MAQKIIIDTDPGVDDAMAILLALRSAEFNILGLTTVFGNSWIENTTRNALRLLELEGREEIAVARGADRPLLVTLDRVGADVHGEDGLGNLNLSEPSYKVVDLHAAQFIIETVKANPGEVTLVPIGPLTNIALALRLEPAIAAMVKEVVIMGGAASVPGNISPVAEANIYNDPHAARIVFSAAWKLTMVGLDVTTRLLMGKVYLDEIVNHHNSACQLIGKILPCYREFHDAYYRLDGAIHTHDPSAILYLLRPELFTTRDWPVYVETEGYCRGQTIPDYFGDWVANHRALQTIHICTDVDVQRALNVFRERMIA